MYSFSASSLICWSETKRFPLLSSIAEGGSLFFGHNFFLNFHICCGFRPPVPGFIFSNSCFNFFIFSSSASAISSLTFSSSSMLLSSVLFFNSLILSNSLSSLFFDWLVIRIFLKFMAIEPFIFLINLFVFVSTSSQESNTDESMHVFDVYSLNLIWQSLFHKLYISTFSSSSSYSISQLNSVRRTL